MKKLIRIITIILLCSTNGLIAQAEETSTKPLPPASVNIMDFGAIPNDHKDDSDAIEKAIKHAVGLRKGLKPQRGSYIYTSLPVFFPPGRYNISRQISIPGFISLCSNNGRATIEWKETSASKAETESMFKINAYSNSFENLIFIGGKTHLIIHNANINQTLVDINHCEFQHSSGIAVRAIPSGKAKHLSTQLTIRNCKFIFNYMCLETYCDYATVVDSWVELRQPQMKDGAAFVNKHGHLFFDRMLGVPCADISKAPKDIGKNLNNARWVDNYGTFSAINSRFGAEGGGIPVVYQFQELELKYPWICSGSRIDIKSCSVYTGSRRRPMGSVIVLNALPQLVTFKDNIGPVNNPLFKVGKNYNLAGFMKKLKGSRHKTKLKKLIKYEVKGNLTFPDIKSSILPELREFVK